MNNWGSSRIPGDQRLSVSMRKSLFLLRVFGLVLLLLSPSRFTDVWAQATKLNVASSGISPTQIIPYLAQEAGIYARNGLDVSVIRTRAEIAVMSLLNGDTTIVDVAGPIIIRSNLKGADGI